MLHVFIAPFTGVTSKAPKKCSSFALIFLYHFWKNDIVGSEYMDGWVKFSWSFLDKLRFKY